MESAFRDTCPDDLKVIETFRSDPDRGFVRWETGHRPRVLATCQRLGISVAPAALDQALETVPRDVVRRVRLTVDLSGAVALACPELPATPTGWRVALAGDVVGSTDPWLGVKTTRRALYDNARAALPEGVDELLFCNETGALAEGTITNLFVETRDGLATPPFSAGVLPGVLRAELIASGWAYENELRPADLDGARIFMGNSLRGLIPATLV